jgi:hypothetical protein
MQWHASASAGAPEYFFQDKSMLLFFFNALSIALQKSSSTNRIFSLFRAGFLLT